LNWFGKSEMKTLKGAEQQRFLPQLSGAALVSAFYLNELVFKLTHREVPHEALFDAYEAAIETLAGARGAAGRHGGGEPLGRAGLSREDIAATLRVFEVALMRELGYGLRFEEEAASHAPIVAECRYWYAAERGAVLASAGHERPQDALELSGKTMIDMARGDYRDPVTLAESKLLMRHLISRLLGGKVLFSRALMREMK
jgi:DNA repair protein RecO (recombination protein O)